MRKGGIIPFHYLSVLLSEYFFYIYTSLTTLRISNYQTIVNFLPFLYVLVENVEQNFCLFFFVNPFPESVSACGKYFPACGKKGTKKEKR